MTPPTHRHRQAIPVLAWVLLALQALSFIAIILLGLYLDHRRAASDARAEKERKGVCAILDHIPPDDDGIDAARTSFRCKPYVAPPPIPKPRKTSAIEQPGAQPPGTRVTVTVAPQPQATRTNKPRPSKSPSAKPTPTPSPTRPPLVDICVRRICIP